MAALAHKHPMTDITPYLNKPDILNNTAQQIIKDFGMCGVEIRLSDSSSDYSGLFLQILPQIEILLKENSQRFYGLMYRIDISEGQIKKAVESSTNKTFAEVVTNLILKRELLKVVIRKSYSARQEL